MMKAKFSIVSAGYGTLKVRSIVSMRYVSFVWKGLMLEHGFFLEANYCLPNQQKAPQKN